MVAIVVAVPCVHFSSKITGFVRMFGAICLTSQQEMRMFEQDVRPEQGTCNGTLRVRLQVMHAAGLQNEHSVSRCSDT